MVSDTGVFLSDDDQEPKNIAEEMRAKYRLNIGGLPTYADLASSENPEDQALLERVNERLEQFGDFTDANQVIMFGSDTVKKLSIAGRDITDYVLKIDYADFENIMEKVVDKLKETNLEDLVEISTSLAKDAANTTTRKGLMLMALAHELASKTPVVGNLVPETRRQRERRLETETDKFLKKLPDMVSEIDSYETAFEEEFAKLENLKPKIREFTTVLLEVIDDLEVDIIALQEQSRRAEADLIPAAEAELKNSGRTIHQEKLYALQSNAASLDAKHTDFIAQRSNGLNTLNVAKTMMNSLSETQRQLQTLHTTGVSAWNSNAASIAMTAAVRSSSRKVISASDFSNKMVALGAQAHKNTALDVAKNSNIGAFDPAIVAQATQTYISTVKEQRKILLENKKSNEANRSLLLTSQKDLQQAVLSAPEEDAKQLSQMSVETPAEKDVTTSVEVEPTGNDQKLSLTASSKKRPKGPSHTPR